MSSVGGSAVPPLNVRIVISTSGAGSAATAMRTATSAATSMGGSFARAQVPIRSFGDSMRQTSSLINYTMIMPLYKLGSAAIQASRQFESSMKKIQGLVGVSAKEVSVFSSEILKMAGGVGKSPQELGDAMYFIASAGLRGAEAMNVLRESAKSAAAGLGETKIVADALTSVINAYGKNVYTAVKANDILTATVREGKTEADQFAPALGKVLPIAATFGASFEDISAGMASLTRTGTTAGTSAIYLRQVMSQLLKPAKAAREALDAAGTSADEIRQNVKDKGLLNALSELNAKLGGTDTSLAVEGLTKVFGNVRALQAVLSLLGPNLEENRKIFAEVANSAGDSARAFEIYRQSADFAFKQTLATGQTTLIGLGNSLMPLVTGLAHVATVLGRMGTAMFNFINSTKGFSGFIGGIVRAVMLFAAAALLTGKVANGMFRTMASGVRMMAHLGNVFNGLTNGVRKSGMAAARTSTQYAGLTMTAEQEAAAEAEINAEIAAGTLTRSKLAGILARNNASLTESATLKTVEKITTDQATISQQGLALAIDETTAASASLGVTMATLLPQVFAIGIAITTIASIFGVGPFGGKTKTEKTTQSLTDLNSQLGITAGYATTGMSLNINIMATDGKTPAEIREELIKNLETSVFGSKKLIENALKSGIASQRIDAGLAIMSQMTFDSEASKNAFVSQLSTLLNIKASDLTSPANQVADVIKGQVLIAAGQISNLKISPDIQADTEKYGTVGEQTAQAYLDGFGRSAATSDVGGQAAKFFKNLGDASAEAAKRSGDFGGVVEQIGAVGSAIQANDVLTQESYGNVDFLAKAFGGLKDSTTGIDFKGAENGLRYLLANKDNTSSFISLFEQMGLNEGQAKTVLAELNDEFKKNPAATVGEQMLIFNGVITNSASYARAHADAMRDSANAGYDAATEFQNGLNPAIQDQVTAYDEATAAIKRYQEGQKALAGLSQDFITAQIDANEAAGGLGTALSKSGGKVGTSGLAGESYKALIKFKDEALNVANIMAADPLKGPGQSANYLAQQYTNAINALTAGGTDLKTAQQQLADIGFTLTDTADKASVLKTYTGNKEGILSAIGDGTAAATPGVSKDIVAGLTEGLKLSQTDMATISEFNAKLVAQFKSDWGIKSPSKKAEEEIGGPIFKGIMKGILDPANILDLKARMKDMGNSAGAGFKSGMLDGLAGTPEGFAADAARYAAQAAIYMSRGGKQANKNVVENMGFKIPAKNTGGTGGTGSDIGVITIVPGPISPTGGSGGGGGGSKKIETPAEKALQKVMDKMSNFSTVFIEFIDKAVKDSKSALSYISAYIDAQMKVASSMIDRQKLVIEQLAYESKLRKAEREAAYNAQKFGANAGSDVTAYEMSRIQDLQLAYETASRNYAMRRGSLTAMIDAEQALLEARAAAAEVNPDVISGQTSLLDAQLKLKNKDLELAAATVDVTEAALAQTEAAINLKIHMADASKIFASFAKQTIPDVAKSIDDLGLSLSDPNGTFQFALHGLGMDIFNKIAEAAREAGLISSVPKYVSANPIETPGGATGTGAGSTAPGATFTPVGQPGVTSTYGTPSPELLALWRSNPSAVRPEEIERFQLWNYMAMGGIVANGPVKAIVGEAGPEAIIPLNSINTRLALQNLVGVPKKDENNNAQYGNRGDVYITVNNPIAEAAEESIARRMKALATAGQFR